MQEQWVFLLEGFPNVLETPIHLSIAKYEVRYPELLVWMNIDWRPQQSVQFCGIDQLPLLLE